MSQDSGYGIQDSATPDQFTDAESGILNPESRILDPVVLERVRWRCRRGMLELDIVLARFVDRRYAMMEDSQRAAFEELLDLPDTELWDLVSGKCETELERLQAILGWLRTE